jgi:hypothetical protein
MMELPAIDFATVMFAVWLTFSAGFTAGAVWCGFFARMGRDDGE